MSLGPRFDHIKKCTATHPGIAGVQEETQVDSSRRVILVERPRYIVPTANCFRLATGHRPDPGPGEMRIRTQWLSMDVMLYSQLKQVSADVTPLAIDATMVGPTVGTVEASNLADFPVGTLLSGYWGWQEHAISTGRRLRKLDFGVQKPSYGVSAYGSSAFGAYIALEVLAPVAKGETVVVGTALGGLGHIAGQIAKLKGARVVGIAGSADKCRIAVEQLGFDACVDHKAKDFAERLRAACPNGVDVNVETIGGRSLDAIAPLLNHNARIAACGLMDTPHLGDQPFEGRYTQLQSFLYLLINRRVSMRGLVVFDYIRSHGDAFHRDMKAWIDAGQVKPMEDIVNGLENAPAAFNDIFMGRNCGKRLIRVAD